MVSSIPEMKTICYRIFSEVMFKSDSDYVWNNIMKHPYGMLWTLTTWFVELFGIMTNNDSLSSKRIQKAIDPGWLGNAWNSDAMLQGYINNLRDSCWVNENRSLREWHRFMPRSSDLTKWFLAKWLTLYNCYCYANTMCQHCQPWWTAILPCSLQFFYLCITIHGLMRHDSDFLTTTSLVNIWTINNHISQTPMAFNHLQGIQGTS